jgi:hypothetical protein
MSNRNNKELSKLAFINSHCGNDLHEIIEQMVSNSNTYQIRVTTVFNDIQFIVEPGMVASDAFKLWKMEMRRQGMKNKVFRRNLDQ